MMWLLGDHVFRGALHPSFPQSTTFKDITYIFFILLSVQPAVKFKSHIK